MNPGSSFLPAFLQLCGWLLPCCLLIGCNDEPFTMVQCRGKVSYDDGTLLPEEVRLNFVPQTEPVDERTWPRPGLARVDPQTGEFTVVSSHIYGDGLVAGKHTVYIRGADNASRPRGVPKLYTNPDTSPLEVDTAHQPFDLKIPKSE